MFFISFNYYSSSYQLTLLSPKKFLFVFVHTLKWDPKIVKIGIQFWCKRGNKHNILQTLCEIIIWSTLSQHLNIYFWSRRGGLINVKARRENKSPVIRMKCVADEVWIVELSALIVRRLSGSSGLAETTLMQLVINREISPNEKETRSVNLKEGSCKCDGGSKRTILIAISANLIMKWNYPYWVLSRSLKWVLVG